MDAKLKVSPKEFCREVGLDHLRWVEVMRRIHKRIKEEDIEVITKTIGTFYLSKHKATTKTLNGIVYPVPAKEVVALRGPRFPGEETELDVSSLSITHRFWFAPEGSTQRATLDEDQEGQVVIYQSPSNQHLHESYTVFFRNHQKPSTMPSDGDAAGEFRLVVDKRTVDGFEYDVEIEHEDGTKQTGVGSVDSGWHIAEYTDGSFIKNFKHTGVYSVNVSRTVIRVDESGNPF